MTRNEIPEGARHAAGPGSLAHRAGVLVRALAVVLSVVVVAASGYAWVNLRNLTDNVGRIGTIASGAQGGGQAARVDGTEQNILLVGLDDREGATPAELAELSTQQDGGSMNTDTMMVLHLPADGSRATVISLPRDSWVSIKGFGKGKLNSAYPDGFSDGGGEEGGSALLRSTIEGLTGLHIDHYVSVSLLAFYRISNAIGGVPVCLKAAQNPSTDSDANGSGYSGIDLPAGESTIQGKQALSFVRQRHGLPNGDLDRIVRQQYFLSHAFTQIASAGTLLNPFALNRLIGAVSSSLTVDGGLDLLQLASQVRDLTPADITFATIPNTGPQDIYYGGQKVSIVGLDYAAIPAFIARTVGQPTAYDAATPVPPATVSVTVVNGTGTTGLASRNGAALATLGFTLGEPESADTTTATTISYPAGMEAQAKTLAAAVPGAAPVLVPDATGIRLELGTDGVEVPGANPAGPPSATRTTTAAPTTPPSSAAPTTTAPVDAGLADCIN